MKKEDIYNALSDIRPEYLDEADNYKTTEGNSVNNSENENNIVSEEYPIRTETHSGRRYVKYAASAAALILIAGTAFWAANIKLHSDNENLSIVSVSETQTSSPVTEPSVSDSNDTVKEASTANAVSESTVQTESETTNSETTSETVISTMQNISEDSKEQKNETDAPKENNNPSDNDTPAVITTERSTVTETVTDTPAESQIPEVTVTEMVKEIHLPNIPYDPTEQHPYGESISPENFSKMLESLSYSPETCDGLPEYRYTAPDGTEYYILMSCKHVWRHNKDQNIMEEAELSDYNYSMIMAYIAFYGLEECMWD